MGAPADPPDSPNVSESEPTCRAAWKCGRSPARQCVLPIPRLLCSRARCGAAPRTESAPSCPVRRVQHPGRGQRQPSRGAGPGAETAWPRSAPLTRSAQTPQQEAPGPVAPHRLPPWPHAGRSSPQSLCPRAWGRWVQAAPGPGPSSRVSSAAWRTPLRTRLCSWTHWEAAGTLGLGSPATWHAAARRGRAKPAETVPRTQRVAESVPARFPAHSR